jgi:hypothetical protein
LQAKIARNPPASTDPTVKRTTQEHSTIDQIAQKKRGTVGHLKVTGRLIFEIQATRGFNGNSYRQHRNKSHGHNFIRKLILHPTPEKSSSCPGG